MNFSADVTKDLYNYPLEKADRPQVWYFCYNIFPFFHFKIRIIKINNLIKDYVDELTKKLEIIKENEPYLEKLRQKLEVAKVVNELFKNKEIDW